MPPNIPKATFTGSGTAVMSRLQPTRPFGDPLLLLSHSTNPQVLLGFKLLKPVNVMS